MTDFKAQLLDISRTLDLATAKANTYTDPNLTPEGLQARRAELVATARAQAAPQLAALRAEVARDAQALAVSASASLPKLGTDADSTARTAARWSALAPLLAKGAQLRDILRTADIETSHAIGFYGPAHEAAATYRAGEVDQATPDTGPLLRAVDQRLAQLTGDDATSALAASHEATAIAAGIEVQGRYLADVIAGTATGMSAMDASIAAHYAAQGLAADTAPAAG